MSNLGRKLVRWTYSEITRLHLLHAAGKSRAEIAANLEISEERVRQRLQWEAQSGTIRQKRRSRQKVEQKSPRVHFEIVSSGPKPTDEALRLRAARNAATPRDLTGAFFGDPPVGFSALELRA